MGRRVRNARLETRQARFRLAVRPDPYFQDLGDGLHLGYRRRASGGSWVARMWGEDSRYREERIGLADDYRDADGVTFLSYAEAQRKVQAWGGVRRASQSAGIDPGTKATVADVMSDYLADYEVRGKAISQTKHVINTKIIPALGEVRLSRLTKSQVRAWLNAIAKAPASKRGGQPRDAHADEAEGRRRRQVSANRALNVLRAALNYAHQHDRVASDAAWATVKPFRNVERAVLRFLTEADAKRLVNAADEDFADLVRGALLTGCRYGELIRLKGGDVHAESRTVAVREAKGGKPRHVMLTDEGTRFFASLTAGRARAATVFLRSSGKAWSKSDQLRPMLAACERARIKPPISFHILRHTHASWLAARGVPLQVIAKQLGHADIRMTEMHYSHLQPSYVGDQVRANLPELGIKAGKVTALQ